MRSSIRASTSGILFLTLFLTLAGSAWAQFNQYTSPGGPTERPVSRKEELEKEVEEARFRLGPVRVDPWLALRDFAYMQNLLPQDDQPESDLTLTVGAGLRAYLPTGPKVTWTAAVLPEYVWWADRESQRRVNGRYSVGSYAYFNRLTVEATAGREQQQRILTPEVPLPVSGRTDSLQLNVETEVGRTFSVFTGGVWSEHANLVDELDDPRTEALELLDRSERVVRAGVRWRPRRPVLIGLGAERSEVEFDRSALDRSNVGTAPVVELQIERQRLFVRVDLAFRSLEARQGSSFVPYDEVTGNVGVAFGSTGRIQHWLYASRNLGYTLATDYAYLEDQRAGASVAANFGRRIRSRVFVEAGTNDYTVLTPTAPRREEDVVAYGGSVEVALYGPALLVLKAVRSEFDSNLPEADRSYTTAGFTITLVGR